MDTLMEKRKQLLERLDSNFNEFKRETLELSKGDIFDRSYKITAFDTVYRHMRNLCRFDEQSLNYLLKFENPLELVADHYKPNIWVNINGTIDRICDAQDLMDDYPLMPKGGQKRSERER